ncbi:MAG: DUF928 domain-containing protein [Symploca sp. SIO2C1]|nr:DUF928 domain-containing protein [Symploca sp. SIO2C1]
MKTAQFKILKLMMLGLSVAVFSGLFIQVQAQSQRTLRSESTSSNITPIVNFEPPNEQKIDKSRGGASRPTDIKCSRDETYSPPMTSLLPSSQQGLTVATHPTFWVYIPQTSAPQAHFTLKDENNRGVYQTRLPIKKAGRILSISLPKDKSPLEVGKTYRWSVALICQPTQTDIPIVGGKVKRVESNSALMSHQSVGTSSELLLEEAVSYGKEGYWYDMLNNLAKLRQTHPDDNIITTNWINLLNSEGLEKLANKPL